MLPQVSIKSIMRTSPLRGTMGALILCFGSGGAAFGDHTFAEAELTAHGGAEGACPAEACPNAECLVQLEAHCTDTTCTIKPPIVQCSPNQCNSNINPIALKLYQSGSTSCDAAMLLGDLLQAPFAISHQIWHDAIEDPKNPLLVTADLGPLAGGGGDVKLSGNLFKAVRPIPTVSDWGMLVMLVLVLAIGSVVYRRRRARS